MKQDILISQDRKNDITISKATTKKTSTSAHKNRQKRKEKCRNEIFKCAEKYK